MRCKALQFYVSLYDSSPFIWRRLVIPANYSFYQLHMAIQAAFGWENAHLFQFGKTGLINDDEGIGIPYEESDTLLHDARTISINSIFKKKGNKYVYIYDFGDYWEHRLLVESVLDKEIYAAYCTEGANECPPEDVGGIHGYKAMLDCLATGTKKEKQEYLDWLGLLAKNPWDASHFSIRETNKRLSLVKPID